jgi:oligopeptide transport system ATP-binding protein
MSKSLLEIKDLHVSFLHNGTMLRALKKVSFHLSKGEILGIVGESGCGKSICSQAILRLLPPNASIQGGEIVLDGVNLLSKKESEMSSIRGKKIGMIFQDPFSSLNPSIKTGKQIIEILLKHQICPKQEAKKRVLDLFDLAGINDPEARFDQYPHELSGGICQRIAIASALAIEPEILIADEPTTALDASIQIQILSLLQKIQESRGMSLILISHDLRIIMRFCHRVLVMYAGQIVETGSVEEILNAPKHPYTKGLIEATPYFGAEANQKLQPIPGSPPTLSEQTQGCPFARRCPKAMNICLTPPPFQSFSENHRAACWLYDPRRKP